MTKEEMNRKLLYARLNADDRFVMECKDLFKTNQVVRACFNADSYCKGNGVLKEKINRLIELSNIIEMSLGECIVEMENIIKIVREDIKSNRSDHHGYDEYEDYEDIIEHCEGLMDLMNQKK